MHGRQDGDCHDSSVAVSATGASNWRDPRVHGAVEDSELGGGREIRQHEPWYQRPKDMVCGRAEVLADVGIGAQVRKGGYVDAGAKKIMTKIDRILESQYRQLWLHALARWMNQNADAALKFATEREVGDERRD